MMRAGIREHENVIVARFLSGLSLEIRDKVELLPYRDFHDLVKICIKVEQQVLRKGTSRTSYSNSYSKTNYEREGKSLSEKPRENPINAIVQESGKREEEKKKIKRLEKHLAHLGYELKGIELIEEKLNRMIHNERERKGKERKETRERKEQERQDKGLSRAEPNIDIKCSSLESSCEKLSEPLSKAEIDVDSSSIEKSCEELVEEKPLSRDIDTNSSYTKKFSEDIFVEQSLCGAELDIDTKTSLIEKPCELLEIKQEDQNIRQIEKYSKIKNKSILHIIYSGLTSGKGYINLGKQFLFICIFKCYEKMQFVLLLFMFL